LTLLTSSGEKTLPDPSFIKFKNAKYASVDKNNNYYFEGEPPQRGSSYIRVSAANEIEFWTMPLMQVMNVVADPNGRYMAFMYNTGDVNSRKLQRAMGMLDLSSGKWTQVRIPSLVSCISIPVKAVLTK
jgi:hypothetical protein